MKKYTFFTWMLLALSTPTFPSPVTLESAWYVSNSQGGGIALLSFTYEDSVGDSNTDPSFGVYNNPLLNLSMIVGNEVFSLNDNKPNSISLISSPTSHTFFRLLASVVGAGEPFDLSLFIEDPAQQQLSNDSLTNFKNETGSRGDSELWLSRASDNSMKYNGVIRQQLAAVPLPGALSFFITGVLCVFSAGRKSY